MDTNQKAVELIKRFEGFRPDAYLCPGGKWTIGYGHTEGVKPGMEISIAEAQKLLAEDIARIETAITPLIKIKLAENQNCAIVSLVFNIGVRAFERSTLLQKLNAGDLQGAADQILVWEYVNGTLIGGLRKRREVEREAFISTT